MWYTEKQNEYGWKCRMYYDTYRGKHKRASRESGRRRPRKSCLGWLLGALLRLVLLVLVLAVLAAAVLYALPVSFLNVEPAGSDLSLNGSLPGDRVNILLLGLDYMRDDFQRSDTMIVASVGKDSVRLASILRDTMVEIPGKTGLHKINSAYAAGGAETAMQVVNETFGLNITNYIAIDLKTLVDFIDAVGGIDVEISENELEQLNSLAYNTYKKIASEKPEKYAHYLNSQPVTQAGTMHLDGLFATSFARIRKVGSDYARTERQQEVISAVLRQVKGQLASPGLYLRLFNVYRESVMTNLSLPEIISIGEKVLLSGEFEKQTFPAAAHRYDNGSDIQITDLNGNRKAIYNFLYAERTQIVEG